MIRHALVRPEQVFYIVSSLASSSVVNDYFPASVSTHTKIQNPSASLPVLLSQVSFMPSRVSHSDLAPYDQI